MKKNYDQIIESELSFEVLSSPKELADFINSSVYQDFLTELQIRIDHTTMLLDDLELSFSGRHYDMFRGRKRNLYEMQQIFSDMLENKENDLELKERESQNARTKK